MELDRTELEALLRQIADASPGTCDDLMTDQQGNLKRQAQLKHLEGLGLITYQSMGSLHDARSLLIYNIAITAQGIGHLGRDGGLSREVGTLTIRVDAEQFRQMLLSKIEGAAGATHEQRSELAEQIGKLPAKALEKLTAALLSKGVDFAVQSLPQLGTLLAQALAP